LWRREDEERTNVSDIEEEDGVDVEVPAEIETPLTFAPQDLPATAIDIAIPSSILQVIEPPPNSHDVGSLTEAFVEVPPGTLSSPTFSISTVSDFTPTELDEDTGEGGGERVATRHDTFYFEDGNVEVMCGDTLFRVHSTVVSLSSPKLREMFSPPALLSVPTPEGPPRIIAKDSSEDFAVLLKMIYTPGWVFLYLQVNSVD
jgi:hypothetical protein